MKVEPLHANDMDHLGTNANGMDHLGTNANDMDHMGNNAGPTVAVSFQYDASDVAPVNVDVTDNSINTRASDLTSHRPNQTMSNYDMASQIINITSPFTQFLLGNSPQDRTGFYPPPEYYIPQGVDSSVVSNPGQQFVSSTSVIAGHSSHLHTQNNSTTVHQTSSYHSSLICVDKTMEPTPAKRTRIEATMNNQFKQQQGVQDRSSCGLCQKVLSDPVTLPCLDSFCLACLESYQFSPTPACPRCQTTFFIPAEGLRAMPYNKFTEKAVMLQRICNQDVNDKLCDICCQNRSANQAAAVSSALAEKYCLECGQKFCTNCLAYHTRMKCTSSHQVVELGIESSHQVQQVRKEKDQYCSTHSTERVLVQCLTCDELVCRLCHEQHHSLHSCQWFTEEIKSSSLQEIDVMKKRLIDSLREKQDVIGRLENELSTREREILNARQCVTQKVIQLKEAIDDCEQQLKQDLDNYYRVNVTSLQTDFKDKKTVIASMRKLELFMQDVHRKGSDCDIVQFNPTLCQRSDNLLSASFSNDDIEELRLSFSASNSDASISNLIGELTSQSPSIERKRLAEINQLRLDDVNEIQMERFGAQAHSGTNVKRFAPLFSDHVSGTFFKLKKYTNVCYE